MEPLRPDQQRAAPPTLAEAFATDPLLEIVAPDPNADGPKWKPVS